MYECCLEKRGCKKYIFKQYFVSFSFLTHSLNSKDWKNEIESIKSEENCLTCVIWEYMIYSLALFYLSFFYIQLSLSLSPYEKYVILSGARLAQREREKNSNFYDNLCVNFFILFLLEVFAFISRIERRIWGTKRVLMCYLLRNHFFYCCFVPYLLANLCFMSQLILILFLALIS